ncbi:MAG: hypothetical protein LCH91_05315 [Bacteroidetes bacterium]|nr:hypothetical protein [Bacteroidota bacterium]
MDEQRILDTELFVKHYVTNKQKGEVATGLFVLPKEANLKEGHSICIETKTGPNGKPQYIGKVDTLRFPLTSTIQFESFLGFAWDDIQAGQI